MFKKFLASVGIGAAKVDTRLFNDSVVPGDLLEGEVHIVGGDVAQDIDDIYLKLATEYKRETEDSTYHEECVMVNYRLLERLSIQAKEELVVPFSLQLPYEMPLTLGGTPVYVRTGLDIKTAINPKDKDALEVRPHPLMHRVLEAVEKLGFHLHRVDCQYAHHFGGAYPFVQEFEFRPTGNYSSPLDELEIIFNLSPHELEVLMEIDKRARGFKGWLDEALDIDERYARFYLTESDLYELDVEAMIDDVIQSHLH
ncbi:sporulation protein SpoOM [Scytonema sp. UIC 10036]|uniref:sporulation protein n=1 Tax=Scytonema sp. UIC 10036 TaxID=2304196 RepID=UPI0012DAD147|nr:sporulation protein [Scytonema sp. UIC 10036]MUG94467.1 sporulation protein SpoOM [Scytonema sp. UIC 10036]